MPVLSQDGTIVFLIAEGLYKTAKKEESKEIWFLELQKSEQERYLYKALRIIENIRHQKICGGQTIDDKDDIKRIEVVAKKL